MQCRAGSNRSLKHDGQQKWFHPRTSVCLCIGVGRTIPRIRLWPTRDTAFLLGTWHCPTPHKNNNKHQSMPDLGGGRTHVGQGCVRPLGRTTTSIRPCPTWVVAHTIPPPWQNDSKDPAMSDLGLAMSTWDMAPCPSPPPPGSTMAANRYHLTWGLPAHCKNCRFSC